MPKRHSAGTTVYPGDAARAVRHAFGDYLAAASDHGHDSAEAISAKIRWRELRRRLSDSEFSLNG